MFFFENNQFLKAHLEALLSHLPNKTKVSETFNMFISVWYEAGFYVGSVYKKGEHDSPISEEKRRGQARLTVSMFLFES